MSGDNNKDWMSTLGRWLNYYLIAFFFFAWGLAAGRWYIFPGTFVATVEYQLKAFIAGHPDEETSVAEKLMNDMNIEPGRFLHQYPAASYADFSELPVPGLRARRQAPRVRHAGDGHDRIVVAAMDFDDVFWGALLINGRGELEHIWKLSGEIEGLNEQPDFLKNQYGVGFLPDGSVIYNLQETNRGIIKRDQCSELSWIARGVFHHAMTLEEDFRSFWTFGGPQHDLYSDLVNIDTATGEEIRRVNTGDIDRANPKAHIIDLRPDEDTEDVPHPNDVEALPASMAGAFPQFEAGDLMVSHRSTNLVYVASPETLAIKWWYFGAGNGLHDADWQPDGSITLYSNNWRFVWDDTEGRASDIVRIDPDSNRHEVLVAGADHDFFSRINGRHQLTPHGTVLITSTTQGRVLEVDLASGATVFEFVNVYEPESNRTLRVSEAIWLPEGFFADADFASCSAAD